MSFSRRNFLLASASMAALRPGMSRAQSTSTTGSGSTTRPQYLIVCMADGGWDTSYCMDPKPGIANIDQPDGIYEYTQTFHNNQLIQCNDFSRPAVTNFFQEWGDRTAVINGLAVGSIVHEPCRIRLLTGTTSSKNADWATRFGARMSVNEPLGSIDFSGLSYPGELSASTARVGVRSQLKALLDPGSAFKEPTWADYELPLFQADERQEAAVREVLEKRADAYRALRGESGKNALRLDELMLSLDRRTRMQAEAAAITGELDLGAEPSFESQAQLAVGLISKGLVRAVTLKHEMDWDTHANNAGQVGNYQDFFRTLNNLLLQLDAENLLDQTLVVVLSEMGRTPRKNISGGKDHWTHTSELLIGAGIKGGQTFGATDDGVESMKIDLATGEVLGGAFDDEAPGTTLSYNHFVAGLLAHMDMDPEEFFPGVTPFSAFSNLV